MCDAAGCEVTSVDKCVAYWTLTFAVLMVLHCDAGGEEKWMKNKSD